MPAKWLQLFLTLFRQILNNLLTNAFRYTPPGGVVSLNVILQKKLLLIEVTDTGIGIPDEDQAMIFDEFFRCENVENRRGLGLGLSIVRDALQQMDGDITVVSKIGEGTCIKVSIPFKD